MKARAVSCIFIVLCLFTKAYSQSSCPPNLDFESGTFDNWQCFTGTTDTIGGKNRMLLSPSEPTAGRHELITAASLPVLDEYGKFPRLCPYGGNYSVQLGNKGTGAQAEAISYTFVVPTTVDTFTFTYFYAVVFEDPQHDPPEQPRFFVTAYDVETGNLINCASFDYVSTANLPGFKNSTAGSSVLYKDWTPTSLQFAGLGGREVRLEFRTADCTRTGHFGYAYLDIASACSNILATAPYCIETNSLILDAPFGFQSYTWYNSDFTTIIGTGQSMNISPPPATQGVFYVDVVPYPGFGCRDTLQAYVKPMPVPDMPDVKSPVKLCQFDAPNPLSAKPLPSHTLLWYTTPAGGTGTFDGPVPSTAQAGSTKYWVSQKALFGCEGFRRELTVTVIPTPFASFNINKLRQCQAGNSFTFSSTSNNLLNPSYTWEYGNGQSAGSTNPINTYSFPDGGTFYVKLKATNDNSCSATETQTVTVIPKPVAKFDYPIPVCENKTTISLTDRSSVPMGIAGINKWWWNVNENIYTGQTVPSTVAPAAGQYPVKLAVSTTEGCQSDTNTVILQVRHNPAAAFGIGDLLCNNEVIRFTDQSFFPTAATGEIITKWYWSFDNGMMNSIEKNPRSMFTAGVHNAKLITESAYGCKSEPLEKSFDIWPKPIVQIGISDSCINLPVTYTATDLLGNVVSYNWYFIDMFRNGPNYTSITKTYNREGKRPFTLITYTDKGCKDTIYRPFAIYENKSFAGYDTLAAFNQPVQLDARGEPGMQYNWTPSVGLNRTDIEKPVATYDRDQLYHLYTVSPQGCEKHSQIFIKRWAGPELFVPNAFTPDNDGVNDKLKVKPTGFMSFGFFAVYNRWGQLVFRTTNFNEGWDGKLNGRDAEPGTYVYVVQAVDYHGKPLHRKGTVVLLR